MKEIVPATLAGERIDRVVAMISGLPRSVIADLVERRAVTVDGKPVKTRSTRVLEGQEVEFEIPKRDGLLPDAEQDVAFEVLHADDDVIVIEKPAGLVVHPGAGHLSGTLVHGLLGRFPDMAADPPGDIARPGIVHRLDSGTSGLMVVARTSRAYEVLVRQMGERSVERHYVTLVWGHLSPDTGVIDAPIGRSENDRTKMAVTASGREARTAYTVLQKRDDPDVSLVSAQLETGRTHQIRVHMSATGFPVVGDRRYGGARQTIEMSRPFLHARTLRFRHPVTGEMLEFESPLPADLAAVLDELFPTQPPHSSKED